MVLSEVQVLCARIIHDQKQYNEISERIEEVKSMILETLYATYEGDTVYQ